MDFAQWFARAYPVIAQAMGDGRAGPNEVWLRQIAERAFAAGDTLGPHTDETSEPSAGEVAAT